MLDMFRSAVIPVAIALLVSILATACSPRPMPSANVSSSGAGGYAEAASPAPPPVAPPSPPEAFEAFCDKNLPPVTVEIAAAPLEIRYRNDTPLASLGPGTWFEPLPDARLYLEDPTQALWVSAKTGLAVLRRGVRQCVRPRFEARLAVPTLTVSIAKEYVPGTCAYQYILDHENGHVAAVRQQLQATADWASQRLREQFGSGIIYLDGAADAEAMLEQAFEAEWVPLLQAKFAEIQAVHEALDASVDPAAIGRVCGSIPNPNTGRHILR